MTLLYIILSFIIGVTLLLNRNKVLNYSMVWCFALLQWFFTIHAYLNPNTSDLHYFSYDALGTLLLFTLSVIAVPAIIHSKLYVERHNESAQSRAIYFSSLVILIAAISLAYIAQHVAVMWIFVEMTTLAASTLIYHHRNKLALEGTWKYVFICAISITFIYIGILFLSLSLNKSGEEELTFTYLLAHSQSLNPFWLRLAFLFIFTGFTAKAGLVPMFTAGVDAKDKAPGPAAAILSSVLMNMGALGIFRTFTILANSDLHQWVSFVLGISGFLSIFIATVYMLKVKNIKRMFAYSSIEHMGIVMLGLAAGGIGYYAAILHIVLHALVKSSLFFQYNQVYRVFQSKSIYQIGNYFKYNPTGAVVILLCFISATAMPPSGLFVSEFLIFKAIFAQHQFILLAVVLILLTFIIWAFGKNVLKMLFTPVVGFDESQVPVIKPWESISQFVLLVGAIYLGLTPPAEFVNLIQSSVAMLIDL